MATIEEVKHPGVHLEEEIAKLGMSLNEFSTRTLIPLKTLNKLIKRECNLTVDVAKKISMFFGVAIEDWMNLQTKYDEYLIDVENHKNINLEIEVVKYFEKDFLKKVVDSKINLNDKESVVYDLENILSQKATDTMLDNLTASFKKNKFMEYLPEEVRGSLKMDLIFDKEALLDATLDKSLYFIGSSQFRKRVFRFREESEFDGSA